MESGQIDIHAENILPIIKRWLYTEKEIFLRELVSNASDAILKLGKLALVGEAKVEPAPAAIRIEIDKPGGRLLIHDTGLGMTADEVKKYINQVAFSGVHDFVERYKDKDDSQQVIGHFGLGFYSAFMVASKVEIETLSYQEGATPVRWVSEGSTAFMLGAGSRTEVGTTVILHMADDSKELLDEGEIRMLVARYCAFIRHPIFLGAAAPEEAPLNDPTPLWTRSPSELEDADYKAFYAKLFPALEAKEEEPLFWVHLNVDYPFKLKGVLYFPRFKQNLGEERGEVKLYCNQVYVADNVKELVPEWLLLLKGVIDCPDLSLNVGRSYLQSDPMAKKIMEHITKKVADRLTGLAKTEREAFAKYWDDIHAVVKFGMMRDQKFAERMTEHVLFKLASGGHATLAEYAEKTDGKAEKGVVVYASDPATQAAYLSMLKDLGVEAVIADSVMDVHFLPFLEYSTGRKWKFRRVDADLAHHLIDSKAAPEIVVDAKGGKTAPETLSDLFKKYLGGGPAKLSVRVETLKSDKVPAMLIIDEEKRRMNELAKSGAYAAFLPPDAAGPLEHTLVVNASHPAMKSLVRMALGFHKEEDAKLVVEQIYDLAWLQQGAFTPERMQAFVDRSATLLEALAGKLSTPKSE
jgi:molecular chaperone HtpG